MSSQLNFKSIDEILTMDPAEAFIYTTEMCREKEFRDVLMTHPRRSELSILLREAKDLPDVVKFMKKRNDAMAKTRFNIDKKRIRERKRAERAIAWMRFKAINRYRFMVYKKLIRVYTMYYLNKVKSIFKKGSTNE